MNMGNLNQAVKSVEIVFENLESIIVPADRFDNFSISDVTPNFFHQKHLNFNLHENMMYSCKELHMDISYQHDTELLYDQYEDENPLGMFVGNSSSNRVSDRPNILGRILGHSDISHVEFLNERDEAIINIAVPWSGEYVNEYMNVRVRDKHLEISFNDGEVLV